VSNNFSQAVVVKEDISMNMSALAVKLAVTLAFVVCITAAADVNTPDETVDCDVIIVGGSAAALAAALAAADFVPGGFMVCLTEPTDWLGGQFTTAAVSAPDFGQYNFRPQFQTVRFQVYIYTIFIADLEHFYTIFWH
jgi:heterodisulfide reductase subunit A-like polyferredoxin